MAEKTFQLFKNKIEGSKQPGIPPQELMHEQQKRFGIFFRQAFGRNFSHNKYNYGCNSSSDGDAALIPDQFNTQKGSNGGRAYIDNIIAHQNCGKNFVKMIQQF